MKRFVTVFFAAVFFSWCSIVFAMFCPDCGKELRSSVKFCPFCGKPQSVEFSAPTLSGNGGWQPVPKKGAAEGKRSSKDTKFLDSDHSITAPKPVVERPAKASPSGRFAGQPAQIYPTKGDTPPSMDGSAQFSNKQLIEMLKPLDSWEKNLSLSDHHIQNIRLLIQRQLIPGLEGIRKTLKEGKIRISKIQAKLLSLYKERYSTILDGAIAMGFQKSVFDKKIAQVTVLHDFLRRNSEDDNLEFVRKIESVFERELENLRERVMNLNEKAGYENPGICYKIPRDEFSSDETGLGFTLYFQDRGRKIGDRMHVFDENGTSLGDLKFVRQEGGFRVYKGAVYPLRIPTEKCRKVSIEYVGKTNFSPKWQKEKLSCFLVPPVRKTDRAEFLLETCYGTETDGPRIKYLRAIGKF